MNEERIVSQIFQLKGRIQRKKDQLAAIINEHERSKIDKEISKLNKQILKLSKKVNDNEQVNTIFGQEDFPNQEVFDV